MFIKVIAFIARIVAFIFLLVNTVIFLTATIKCADDLLHHLPNFNLTFTLLLLILSFALGIWMLGLIQEVFAAEWPKRAARVLRKSWLFALVTAAVTVGLYFLFETAAGFFVAIGYDLGLSLAEASFIQLDKWFAVSFPILINEIIAWEFQIFFASCIVGFLVWVWRTFHRKSVWSELKQAEQEPPFETTELPE
jgi:hypothetical protein